jgi:hypothetical protein
MIRALNINQVNDELLEIRRNSCTCARSDSGRRGSMASGRWRQLWSCALTAKKNQRQAAPRSSLDSAVPEMAGMPSDQNRADTRRPQVS